MRFSLSWLGLALAGVSSLACGAPLPDAIPAELFAKLPTFDSPALSPDGTKIAGKVAVKGQQLLVVQPLFGGKAVNRANGDVDINWWNWVNDDWLVAGIGKDQSIEGQDFYVTRIVGLNADMTQARLADPERTGISADDVIWLPKDGSTHLLLSKETGLDEESDWYPSVFDIDVTTGHQKLVVDSMNGVWDWRADSTGTVRFGEIWRDGKRTGVVYRGPQGGRFQSVAFNDGSVPTPLIFRADGSALAMDDRNGQDEVFELSLPSFALGNKVFGDGRYDVDGIVKTPAGNDAAGFSVIRKRSQTLWSDPALKELQTGLDKTLGEGNARIISWSRDRSKLLVEVGEPSQAGALYYWDTDGARMQLVAWNNDVLKGRRLSPVSTVEYKARDSTTIEAVLTLPRGREAKNLPLIVMPHGGPGARDEERYDWWTQFLAEQGYAVIQPNYRGSTGYGTRFHDLGLGEWGLKMQDDLVDAVSYLAGIGVADPKRVCVIGASYGGYAAERAAQRDYAHYRCAVSYAGVSDLNSMLKYDKNTLGKEAADYWHRQAPDFTAVSPRFHAAEFGIPVLLAHGAADKRVPVKQSRILDAELTKAGKPHEYLEQRLGDHHFSRAEDRLEFLNRLKAFLDRYNPA